MFHQSKWLHLVWTTSCVTSASEGRILEIAKQGDWDDALELVAFNPALAKA